MLRIESFIAVNQAVARTAPISIILTTPQSRLVDNLTGLGGFVLPIGRCLKVCLTDDRHRRIEECLNIKQLMRRNRRGFKLGEIRSIINRVASYYIAFPRCRHIYRNTIRLPSLLSSLAVSIIMTIRKDAFVDFIGVCHEKVSSLFLKTTTVELKMFEQSRKGKPNADQELSQEAKQLLESLDVKVRPV